MKTMNNWSEFMTDSEKLTAVGYPNTNATIGDLCEYSKDDDTIHVKEIQPTNQ